MKAGRTASLLLRELIRGSGGGRLFGGRGFGGLGGQFLFVEVANDAGYVGFGFVVGRDSVVLLDALQPGVVGGKGLDEIEVVAFEEFAEITRAGFDVSLRVEGILHAELGGGLGHELHQSLGAFGGDGANIESAFGADDAGDQIGIEAVGSAGVLYGLGEIEGVRETRELGIGGRSWRVGEGLEVIDFGGGDVDETGLISVDVEAGDGADNLAALVTDGESVAQDGRLGGEAG